MDKERIEKLKDFEEIISYTFNDISLLDNAMTHRSYANENQELSCKDNERLEFLGDAVLELCISDILMKKFPDYTEGQLSKLRASLVNEQPLTELAKKFQSELFERFFRDQELIEWIKDYVSRLKDGELDDLLVYKKKLSRKAEEYTKTTPPHIKAARLEDPENQKNLKEIQYLITSIGPVPVSMKPTDIDYNHYIEKQIKPLADGVLFAIDQSFDEIIEGRQLDLFS